MAPGLVETLPTADNPAFREPKFSTGQYKEAFASGPAVFNPELEEKGNEKFAAAKYPNYLPIWDAEKSRFADIHQSISA